MKLAPLPSSKDEYWADADINKIELEQPKECNHSFLSYGRRATCRHCHMGLYLTYQDQVRDGHIYRGEVLVI